MDDETENVLSIPVDDVALEGELIVPDGATGLVVFAHGSGSSRHSPRNNFVAEALQERGLGTLLFDLLTEQEDQNRENRFDIPLLTDRLVAVTQWLRDQTDTAEITIGYFGASTGAAMALRGAARRQSDIRAVASRDNQVDMPAEVLDEVAAPTLFIVGGEDEQVLERNEDAYEQLDCEKDLYVVAGTSHLFENPGELEEIDDHAGQWFTTPRLTVARLQADAPSPGSDLYGSTPNTQYASCCRRDVRPSARWSSGIVQSGTRAWRRRCSRRTQ